MSGAYEAWITDEVGVDKVGPVFVRGERLSYAGAVLGLARRRHRDVYLLSVIVAGGADVSVGLLCIIAMPESGFRRRQQDEEGPSWPSCSRPHARAFAFRPPYAAHPPSRLNHVLPGAASEAFDRFHEAHLIREVGLPEVGRSIRWSGLGLRLASMVVGLVGTAVLLRQFERGGRRVVTTALRLDSW